MEEQVRTQRFTLAFLEHLRGAAMTVRPEPVHDGSPAALLLQRYASYLREERGLAGETVCNYQRFVSVFVRERLAVSATGVLGASSQSAWAAAEMSADEMALRKQIMQIPGAGKGSTFRPQGSHIDVSGDGRGGAVPGW